MEVNSILTIVAMAFWALCAMVALMPLSWALPAYLLLAQLDPTPSDFAGGQEIGIANTLKIAVLPTLLYLRIRRADTARSVRSQVFARVWLGFVCYVALASLWTTYRVPALKMLGFLYAYTLIFAVFVQAWHLGKLNGRVITATAWASLVLAVLQTYFLGNYYGTSPDGSPYATQFTSFIDAQSFAPFLLALLVFQIMYGSKDRSNFVLNACLLIAIVLAGSRYVLAASALSLLILYAGRSHLSNGQGIKTLAKAGTVTVLLVLALGWAMDRYFPSSRVNEVLSAALSRGGSADDIVNLAWRLRMYEEVGNALGARSPGQLFVGAGTSSSIALRSNVDTIYDETAADANRVVHNELLRALYEWGVFGCGLLTLFLTIMLRSCFIVFRKTRSVAALACLALFPVLLAGLGVENVLSASGRPNGMAYTLALACFASSQVRPKLAQSPQALH
jgi:hypothetical protein